MSGDDLQVFIF